MQVVQQAIIEVLGEVINKPILNTSLSYLVFYHLLLLLLPLPNTINCFTSLQGTVLSAKFDDASVALGAALLANLPSTAVSSASPEGSVGLSVAELQAARKAEIEMQVSSCIFITSPVSCVARSCRAT